MDIYPLWFTPLMKNDRTQNQDISLEQQFISNGQGEQVCSNLPEPTTVEWEQDKQLPLIASQYNMLEQTSENIYV